MELKRNTTDNPPELNPYNIHMQPIRDTIYPVKTYPELKMKLELLGYSPPSKELFDICHPDDWKWEAMCSIISDLAEPGMTTPEVDRLVEFYKY